MKEALMTAGLLYLAVVSLLAMILTVADKIKAKRNSRRIPERGLMTLALLGGATAMLLTMEAIRHKTKHKRFMIGLPIMILVQVLLLLYIGYRVLLF